MEDLRQFAFASLENNKKFSPTGRQAPGPRPIPPLSYVGKHSRVFAVVVFVPLLWATERALGGNGRDSAGTDL